MRRHTNIFDVEAMLIKPVQRILKYPLLLHELVKVSRTSAENGVGVERWERGAVSHMPVKNEKSSVVEMLMGFSCSVCVFFFQESRREGAGRVGLLSWVCP